MVNQPKDTQPKLNTSPGVTVVGDNTYVTAENTPARANTQEEFLQAMQNPKWDSQYFYTLKTPEEINKYVAEMIAGVNNAPHPTPVPAPIPVVAPVINEEERASITTYGGSLPWYDSLATPEEKTNYANLVKQSNPLATPLPAPAPTDKTSPGVTVVGDEVFVTTPKAEELPKTEEPIVVTVAEALPTDRDMVSKYGGSVEWYDSLPTDTAKREYIENIKVSSPVHQQEVGYQKALSDLAPYKNTIDNTYALSVITTKDLEDNPTLRDSVATLFPDYDVTTLGAKFVDYDQYTKFRIYREGILLVGHKQEVQRGVPHVDTDTGELVIARKGLTVSDYLDKKLEVIQNGGDLDEFNRSYFAIATIQEYEAFGDQALTNMGAVIRPTLQETVRTMAGVNPTATELTSSDAKKLFTLGFSLPFQMTVPFVGTVINSKSMTPTELATHLTVDGLMCLLLFGGPLVKGATTTVKEMARASFGDIGAEALIRKTEALNNALRATSVVRDTRAGIDATTLRPIITSVDRYSTTGGTSDLVLVNNIKNTAADLNNLLIAARTNGVRGLDDLITNVGIIKNNPLAFRNTVEMPESVARALESAKEALMAREAAHLPRSMPGFVRVAEREPVTIPGSNVRLNEVKLEDMDAIFRDINELLRRNKQFSRLERSSSTYKDLVDIEAEEFMAGAKAREALTEAERLSRAINNSADQSAKYWTENQIQNNYKSLVEQYAERELAEQPTREALMQQARLEASAQTEKVAQIAESLQYKIVGTKIIQTRAILSSDASISPTIAIKLLLDNKLVSFALYFSPERCLSLARQVDNILQTQFINESQISNPDLLQKLIEADFMEDNDLASLQEVASNDVINSIAITPDDLIQIIAVPTAQPIISVSPTTEAVVVPTTAPMSNPLTGEQIQIMPQIETGTQTITGVQVETKTAEELALAQAQAQTQAQAQAQAQIQEQVQAQEDIATQEQTQVKAQTETATQIGIKTKTAQEQARTEELAQKQELIQSRLETELKPTDTKFKPKLKPPLEIILPILGSDSKELTAKQLEGSVAWRQGIMYKLIYPPYGRKDIINSRTPFPNMIIHTGAKSAFNTLTKMNGNLPPLIKRDMGIMDITIVTGKSRGSKPKMKFKRDRYQMTDDNTAEFTQM